MSEARPRPGPQAAAPKGVALRATERIEAMPRWPGRGPMGGGMVAQKAMTFGPSARRLVARLRTRPAPGDRDRRCSAVLSVGLMSTGPRILGRATDLVFSGLFSRNLPAGTTQAQAVADLRARGEDKLATMLSSMQDIVPGQGVDFSAVGQVLLLVLAVYVVASLLAWLQGYVLNAVVQNTV